MRDPYDLRTQEEDAERDTEKRRITREQQVEDLKWLMQHPAGRRIATRLLAVTGVRRTTFNPSGSVMAFNEGRRNVGLWFEGELISVSPEGYMKLLKEFASE
jgi:hypothetical protein